MADRLLRILHVTSGSEPGGVSRYIYDLGSAMRDAGHHVAVAGQRGQWHDLFADPRWNWLDLPMRGGPLALLRARRILHGYLLRNPVDLLHVHYRRSALVTAPVARRAGVPMLFTLHLTGIPLRGPWRWLSRFGNHTHAPSNEARRWLLHEARVPPEQVTVIPHGIEPSLFPRVTGDERSAARGSLGIADDATVACYVGRFDVPKNESWLLDLAAATRSTLPNLRLLLAGNGPHEPALRRRIASKNLADRVTLLPYGPPLPIYRASDALLLPSRLEGFSLACAEAMSVGCAVLRTQTAGASEQIVENVTGRSVPVDRRSFLDVATQFLADRDALRRMGAAAAQHVRTHLTFERQLAQTLSMYEKLVEASAAV